MDRGEDGHGPGRREALTAKIAKVREQRQVQAALLEQLTASGESQISLTDSDARAMVTGKKTTVGYNAQVAVDAKHKLIVEQHVTNAATDMGLLASTAGAARIVLDVERVAAVADMGYYKGEDIEACEASGRRQARAGQRGRQRPLFQGAVPLQFGSRRLPLSRRPASRHPLPLGDERPRVDPVFQPRRLCRVHDQGTLYRGPLAAHQPLGERGGARAHGQAARRTARHPEHSPGDSRAPVRLDQTMDKPGRIPDARAGEGARRIQPDHARLQSQARHHHHRHPGHDTGGQGLISPDNRAYITTDMLVQPLRRRTRRKPGFERPPATQPQKSGSHRHAGEFSHGLPW